jgi:hypothetical protein
MTKAGDQQQQLECPSNAPCPWLHAGAAAAVMTLL